MKALFGSLSFRLAVTYVGLFAASLLLVLGSFYMIVIRMPLHAAERHIEQESQTFGDMYRMEGAATLAERLRIRAHETGGRKPFHAFIGADGRVITANLPSWPRRQLHGWSRVEADDYLDGDEVDYDSLTLDTAFPDGARLLIGRDVEDISETEETLASGAMAVFVVSILVGVLGGALMSLAIGRRIEAVNVTARQVMAGDMSQRVPVRGSGDDFDRLAETLNLMLARIEEALEAVRRVSDSVAHELRTPLARLKADLEDAALVATGDRDARLAAAIGEADRLEKIFDAVLRIARIEAGRHMTMARHVDLSMLLDDAIDYYRPAAEERGIAITANVQPGLETVADADLIFQAMANLIDNAIKYAPVGGSIALDAAVDVEGIVITLTDNGPGIAPEHRAHVVERFYRVPSSAYVPGAGLGLSLVAAIAALHRSSIAFEDGGPGLRVRWTIARP